VFITQELITCVWYYLYQTLLIKLSQRAIDQNMTILGYILEFSWLWARVLPRSVRASLATAWQNGRVLPTTLIRSNNMEKCKGASHTLFSTFVYSYLLSSFTPFTAIIPEYTLLLKQ
jgi:hypothetical protein